MRWRAKPVMIERLKAHEEALRAQVQGAGARDAAAALPAAAAEDYLADFKGALRACLTPLIGFSVTSPCVWTAFTRLTHV